MITEIKNISPNTELIIPEKVNGVTVKSIANYLLRNNKDIVSVTMPDTLTSVGIETFRNCSNLKKVVFSKGLKSIDPGAFEECVSLTEVNLPENLVEIRSDAFAGSGIVKLDLPDSVKSIWQMAFDGCKNLSVLNLNKVEEISQLAFRNCTSLRAVVIPDTVVSLAEYNIFYGCTALAEIKMPDKAIPVSYCTFENTAYADKSLYPSHYENGAFYVDNFLICMDKDFTGSSVTVREGTIVVADSAFYSYGGGGRGCENIVSVSLPEGLKRIGRNSFNGCEKLASLNIPSSVESIGERAFESTKLGVWKDNGLYLDNWLVSVKDTSMNKFTVADGTVGIADSDNALFKTSAGDVKEILLPSTLKYIGT